MNRKHIGVLCIIIASLMWAIEPILAKLAYKSADFLETFVIRIGIMALIALVYAIVTNKGSIKVKKKEIPPLVYLALIGTVVADLVYFYALQRAPVVNAVLIAHMQPVFVILIGFVLLSEALNKFDDTVMHMGKMAISPETIMKAFAFACPLMEVMGDIVMAWMLLWRASIAAEKHGKNTNKKDTNFYEGQLKSAEFFMNSILPVTLGKMKAILITNDAAVEISKDAFGG